MMTLRNSRKSILLGLVTLTVIVVAGIGWRLADRDPEVRAPDVTATAALIAHGAYLVQAADCAACHTAPGGKPFAGGVAFRLPFGTIYSTNITADSDTGIGTWSDDDFVRALHQGIAKDGSHLYPAFPYTSYTGLSRDDAVAIKAYLFSLAKVQAPARRNTLTFPFDQRWTMAFWNFAFLDQHRFRADTALSDQENRGAYLATALGHCGECHTPRNIAFALDDSRQFAGAVIQGWHAYNISSDKQSGLGAWTDRQVADYLSTGHAEGHGSAGGPMGEAVTNSLQYLTPEDTGALVAYLRRVKPQPDAADLVVDPAPSAMTVATAWSPGGQDGAGGLGGRIFEGACASCHTWNGQGRQTPYAALAGSQTVNDPSGANLVEVLIEGANIQTGHGTGFMPSFAKAYSDEELAAVANYVIGHFGGKVGRVTAADVAARRAPQ
jgi:mono/diheme cytochrome c family protein